MMERKIITEDFTTLDRKTNSSRKLLADSL